MSCHGNLKCNGKLGWEYDAVVTSWALCLESLGLALAENLPKKVVKTVEGEMIGTYIEKSFTQIILI